MAEAEKDKFWKVSMVLLALVWGCILTLVILKAYWPQAVNTSDKETLAGIGGAIAGLIVFPLIGQAVTKLWS
jgi:hypothetical protein